MLTKPISEGFKFAFSLKRIACYTVLNFFLFFVIFDMLGRIGGIEEISPQTLETFTPIIGFYFLVFLIYLLSQPLLLGAMIHQAAKFPKEIPLKESFKFSSSLYLRTFLTLLIIGLIGSVIGFFPFVFGLLGAFLFSLAIFYVFPASLLDSKKTLQAFRISVKIFKAYPIKTFLIYLFILLASWLIVLASFLPLIFWLAAMLLNLRLVGVADVNMLRQRLALLLTSPSILTFELLIALATAFASVMAIGVQTRAYLTLKKRRL